MADQKISVLPVSAAITDADLIPIVQGGVTKSILWSVLRRTGIPGFFTYQGQNTAAYVAALVNQVVGDFWIITTGGTIGAIAFTTGDWAVWNGTIWMIVNNDQETKVTGPASATDSRIVVFDGVSGKLVKDGGKTIADVMQNNVSIITNGVQLVGTTSDNIGTVESNFAGGTSYQFPTPVGQTGRRITTMQTIAGQTFTLTTAAGTLVGLPLSLAGAITHTSISSVTWVSDGTNWNAIHVTMKYGKGNMNQYLGGQTYNSIALTLTGSTGFSLVRAVFCPYQTWDGSWRITGNIVCTITAATTGNLTIPGMSFKTGIGSYNQGISVWNGANAPAGGNTSNTDGKIFFYGSSATAWEISLPDNELDAKPTWIA